MLKASAGEGANEQRLDPVLSEHGWPARGGPATSSEKPVCVGPLEVSRSGLLKRHPPPSSFISIETACDFVVFLSW